ncbi:hypothetical protein PTTG_27144 [Puccinia triticina 1-1 BBBD Race 1]|uniref:Velvet domain-containing protein n=1 Tax=Puccinia triticina (isolate 1-1 / race 1 (BBBD)) TaxID=630390 RepID=A0A180GMA7_PUCT1|nr:hypothetical protein PTTG_27144 [Puccinia triticina 1-1 BBBD Race 1]WAR53293.1 hypothetical protein PtB15_2B724 [Puccinia triticina]
MGRCGLTFQSYPVRLPRFVGIAMDGRWAGDVRIREEPWECILFDPPRNLRWDPPESTPNEGCWIAIFDEIGVRTPGRYQICFSLMTIPREGENPSSPLHELYTDPFDVVPHGLWPLYPDCA